MMKIIVGLGNPGKKYQDTRHNVGFMVVDQLAKEWKLEFRSDKKLATLKALKRTENTEIVLAKPMTFMNKSGRAVERLVTCYMLHVTSLIIVHDDLDISLGKFKIQFGKGPRQHKGVESIEKALRTKDFWRARIGIENRKEKLRNSLASLPEINKLRKKKRKISGEEYVLQEFNKKEREIIDQVILEVVGEIQKRINLF